MTKAPKKIDRSALPTRNPAAARPILPGRDPCCVGPCDPPWRDDEQCLVWYETRYFRVPMRKERANEATVARNFCEYIEFRVVYEHRLCRMGKQLGPLLYTFTLLPGERITLYHSERFTQITGAQDRYSVETTFTQFLSRVHHARLTSQLDILGEKLAAVGSGSAASTGGLAGVLGLPETGAKTETSVTDPSSLDMNSVSDQFNQSVIEASRMTHAERSVVISTYAETEVQSAISRTVQNDNACRAVTYFVRQVLELYSMRTMVADVAFRIVDCNITSDWYPINDRLRAPAMPASLPQAIQAQVRANLGLLPKVGQVVERPRPINLPTDGTVYDPELAHCSSCEPEREAASEVQLRKQQAELELLELELERRRLLLQTGELAPFEPALPAAELPSA